MYPSFNWWIGVVEDRVDPAMLGRCKVRIVGYHTEIKEELPTADLPWAVPVSPTTSAGISGIGETPNFIQGASVLGFFADGDEGQQPVIVGSLAGKPRNKNTDPKIGFSDPSGIYPRSDTGTGLNGLQESDLSRLARNAVAEEHSSLVNKRAARQEAIPRAAAPHVDSVSSDIPDAVYTRETWEEPHPRFGDADFTYNESNQEPNFDNNCSVYPYNKVNETESGHVFEVDDTPNNERIHEYHTAGTFYEIQADGSKTTKVVGDEYEITLKDKKVYIKGSCDVTIGGDARMLVTKDMYLEVGGNLFTSVGGDRITKIVGNDLTEVLSGQSSSIKRDQALRVGGSKTDLVIGDSITTVRSNSFATTGGNMTSISIGSSSHTAILGYKVMSATGNVSMNAPIGDFKALSLNMSLSAALNQTVTAAVQLVEASTVQTLSAATSQTIATPLQTIVAATRNITGITSHTGLYGITGPLNVSELVTAGSVTAGSILQGTINLGTHKHLGVTTGAGISGTPTP